MSTHMSTHYKVWVEIEQWVDDEPVPEAELTVPLLDYADSVDETSVEGAVRIAGAMHTFGEELGNLLELWGRRPSHPDDSAGAFEFVEYDADVAIWREELEATIGACMAPVLSEGAHT